MKILFDENAKQNSTIEGLVQGFFQSVPTLERKHNMPIIIFQDGANNSYYVKCSIKANAAEKIVDLNAKLSLDKEESFRANRQLLLKHKTYIKMRSDAEQGREFNDIIVEYSLDYKPEHPLKVWGGQHRISAISDSKDKKDRYHGFRIYFGLDVKQRSEVALISNTNISVSNDTFDRMIEETVYGDVLRLWCQKVGFIKENEDFPDVGSTSERITVKQARSFVVNFDMGKKRGVNLSLSELDRYVYEPYLTETGVTSKVRKVLTESGMYVKGRAVHAFRHTFATETLKNNNIRVTQEALDHKDISTTQIYTHIVAEQKKKAVAALPY